MPANMFPLGSTEPDDKKSIAKRRQKQSQVRFLAQHAPMEERYIKLLLDYFDREKKIVLRNLNKLGGHFEPGQGDMLAPMLLPPMNEENEKLTEISKPILLQAIKAGANQGDEQIAQLRRKSNWSQATLEVFVTERLGLIVEGINLETVNLLAKQLNAAIEAGETIEQMRVTVAGHFDSISQTRSLRIARTEVSEAMNNGILEALKSEGTVKKEWVTFAGCCEECDLLDGEIVSAQEIFRDEQGNEVKGAFEQLIDSPPLHPSCFLHHSVKIHTDEGIKTINEIKIGDKVLTHNGRYKKVERILNKGF